ncbi:ABC transporter ATP-binding protein [Oceanobacillus neutriphilus]|uniref:Oligopeptide transport ATP-binding protein OppD n=1 Tax=Oceanobacillus neutriphilus TaxID=531815 RepID=A0ABQ2NQ79_9BACI|nr:ABC transporter ATP-binding protein [Oceanobacillus neutriphilus]GGP07805.1 oligopeptide transport ATP-binding protein OppD [Oceanobacillus neutriphilus]
MENENKKVLEVEDLRISFDTYAGEVQAIRGISFDVKEGEVVAIVGESGSGKSVTSQGIMKLLPTPPARYKSGAIRLEGKDITGYNRKQMEKLKGSKMAMIFQDPMTSLNPTMKVGRQIAEGLKKHTNLSKDKIHSRVIELLTMVGIPDPDDRANRYPHEFSGGMRQRVMIAIALACEPKLLIADEPTTALDVTIQAQILKLMDKLNEETGTSIILITHDLGVVAKMADRIIVMYAGKPVETGNKHDIFYNPKHPYTWGLLGALPRVDTDKKEPLKSISGTPPDLISPPKGCAFANRCEHAMEVCLEHDPAMQEYGEGHTAACWLHHPNAKEYLDQIMEKHSFGVGGEKYANQNAGG